MAYKLKNSQLIPHLFRSEYSKIVSVLCNYYGFEFINEAEDIASDTFLKASLAWTKETPPNPSAWLHTVAQNKARDLFRRNKIFQEKIAVTIKEASVVSESIDLFEENTLDSQLKMMFVLSASEVSAEAQISLALKILCGFGIEEIAHAFLTNKETINKRLYRAKKKISTQPLSFQLTPQLIQENIHTVLHTIYLLFNEGYFSFTQAQPIRKELCFEALRLGILLAKNPLTNTPEVNALIALMCYHSSRLDARLDSSNKAVLFNAQNTEKRNATLVAKANEYMNNAARGNHLSKYHLEAAIAYWHTQEQHPDRWEEILQLHNLLLQIEYSPMVALNRTYALAKARGTKLAITECLKIKPDNNHLYFSLLATLYEDQSLVKSIEYLQQALKLARKEWEQKFYEARIEALQALISSS